MDGLLENTSSSNVIGCIEISKYAKTGICTQNQRQKNTNVTQKHFVADESMHCLREYTGWQHNEACLPTPINKRHL
jgi:hypothetical protein